MERRTSSSLVVISTQARRTDIIMLIATSELFCDGTKPSVESFADLSSTSSTSYLTSPFATIL